MTEDEKLLDPNYRPRASQLECKNCNVPIAVERSYSARLCDDCFMQELGEENDDTEEREQDDKKFIAMIRYEDAKTKEERIAILTATPFSRKEWAEYKKEKRFFKKLRKLQQAR